MDKIKTNLKDIKEFIQEKDVDWVHAIVGSEGTGKSSLAAYMGTEFDDTFSPDRMKLTGQGFRNTAVDLEPCQSIVFDEGIESLFSRDAMTTETKKMIKFFRKCRYLNLFIIICLPNIKELDKQIRENRIHSLSRTVKQGWMHFYSERKLKSIDFNDNNGIDWPTPDFRDDWPKPEEHMPDFWDEYREKKKRDITDIEKEGEEISIHDIATMVKKKDTRYRSEYKGREYIDQDLVAADFELGDRRAKKVKKLVEADLGMNQ